ncbi:unnamed protein product, partial [Staurois parvus]
MSCQSAPGVMTQNSLAPVLNVPHLMMHVTFIIIHCSTGSFSEVSWGAI